MSEDKIECVLGATNFQRINSLEKRAEKFETAITEIRDRLLGRPSWAVLIIITAMSSLIVGLILALLNMKV